MAARRRLAIAACSLLRPRMPMFSACMSSVRLLSTSQSPSADILNRRVPETGPLGPAEGSFMAQGTSKLVDTLYFRKLAAPKAGKSVLGAYTPDSFSGQVILAVNTASLCGLTPQLRQLQTLHVKYGEVGLTVLGLPCNDFGEQEPWEENRVKAFYKEEYGVTFPVTGKVGINKDRHAFYEVIADLYGPDALPQWNFGKILIGRDGEVKGMFPPQMSPLDAEVVTAITRELESKTKRVEIA